MGERGSEWGKEGSQLRVCYGVSLPVNQAANSGNQCRPHVSELRHPRGEGGVFRSSPIGHGLRAASSIAGVNSSALQTGHAVGKQDSGGHKR